MDFLVLAVVGLLLFVGLLGSLLPFVPGTPLILVGALLHALYTGLDPIGPWRLLILAALAALGYLLDYVAGAAGAGRMGGTAWGVVGALLGSLVGLFFAPLGLVLGPILGAVAGESLRSGRADRRSLKSGFGALLGLVAGALAKAGIAFVMVALVVWWIARG